MKCMRSGSRHQLVSIDRLLLSTLTNDSLTRCWQRSGFLRKPRSVNLEDQHQMDVPRRLDTTPVVRA